MTKPPSPQGRRFLAVLCSVLLATPLALTLSGCVSASGNKAVADRERIAKVVVDESTKDDVRALFGEPMKVSFTDNDEEIWDYMYTRGQTRSSSFIPGAGAFVGGADHQINTLTIRFNSEGVVKRVGSGATTGGGGGIQDSDR